MQFHFRKSIFIFLSNTGGKEITKRVHDIWLNGNVKREELTVKDFERLVELGAFNEEGNLITSQHCRIYPNTHISIFRWIASKPLDSKEFD